MSINPRLQCLFNSIRQTRKSIASFGNNVNISIIQTWVRATWWQSYIHLLYTERWSYFTVSWHHVNILIVRKITFCVRAEHSRYLTAPTSFAIARPWNKRNRQHYQPHLFSLPDLGTGILEINLQHEQQQFF